MAVEIALAMRQQEDRWLTQLRVAFPPRHHDRSTIHPVPV